MISAGPRSRLDPPIPTCTAGPSGWHQLAVAAQLPSPGIESQHQQGKQDRHEEQTRWLLRAWYAAGLLEVSLEECYVCNGSAPRSMVLTQPNSTAHLNQTGLPDSAAGGGLRAQHPSGRLRHTLPQARRIEERGLYGMG